MGIFAKGAQFPANVEVDTPQNRYGGQFTKDTPAGEALGEVISDVNSKAESANTTAGEIVEDIDALEERMDMLEQGTVSPGPHTHPSADITGAASTLGIPAANGAVVKGDTVNGMLKVVSASITDVAHIVNKDYVDKGLATKAPSSHTHSSADITGGASSLGSPAANGAVVMGDTVNGMLKVATASITDVAHIVNKDYVDSGLATKAPSSHSHSWTEVTGKPTTFAPSTHSHTWAQVTGKPSTFAPSSHTHSSADITGGASSLGSPAANGAVVMGDTVNGMLKVASAAITDVAHIVNKDYVDSGLATKAPSSHSHSWTEVTGKPTTFTPSTHSHSWTEVTGKPSTFAPSSHSHSWAQVTGKPTTFTPSSHTHSSADITGGASSLGVPAARGAVVKGDTVNGMLKVATASITDVAHIVNKDYVDKGATRWERWSGRGGPPASLSPVSGQVMVNLSTGQVWKI